MERKPYYVSVQAGTVLEDPEAAAYEFVIHATDKEVGQLLERIEYREEAEKANFRRSFVPGIPYHMDAENDIYDDSMQSIYRMIHRLGTQETKKQIEDMGFA